MMRSYRAVPLAAMCPMLLVFAAAPSIVSLVRAQTPPVLPPPLHWEALAFDDHRERLVLFGGSGGMAGNQLLYNVDTWEWDSLGWRITARGDSGPGARHAHGMAYHPVERRIFLAGGLRQTTRETTRELCDTWTYTEGRWTRVADGPCGASGTTLIYDSRRASMLWIEGERPPLADGSVPRLRIWRWNGDHWVVADTAGPRRAHAPRVAFDAARAVVVVLVFEGPDTGVWEWNSQQWRHVTATGPSARGAPGLAYDHRLEQVVLIGGRADADDAFLGDIWTWDGRQWHPFQAPAGVAPGARSHATLLWDAGGRRLLYFGGAGTGGLLRELWQFDRHGWRPLARP